MLIQLRVENHRSLRDEQVLSVVAEHRNADDPRLIQVAGLGEALLPVAAIYGPNAAGKSAVLHALGAMKHAVVASHRFWSPEEGIEREPFALSPEDRARVSLFEVDLVLDGVRHRYGFTVDDQAIREEWAYVWPHGRQQTWFTREEARFEFGKNFRGENRAIERLTRSNSLFLSAAAQNAHEQLTPLFRWFEHRVRLVGTQFGWWPDPQSAATVLRSEGGREPALALLRQADLGIVDARVEEAEGWAPRRERERILLQHEGGTDGTWLSIDQESMGTRALVGLLEPLLDVLANGGLLVVDELDASLHPALALEIVRLFQSPSRNPRRAQLLFNTHDTTLLGNLLGESPLRRDQVWFVEKDREGVSRLYPLTDYNTRQAENVERGYLQGRYGAVPFPAPFGFEAFGAEEG